MSRSLYYLLIVCATNFFAFACTNNEENISDSQNIAQTAFSIVSDLGGIGCGVFVGYKDELGHHVFLLTARHVATFSDLINKEINILIGRNRTPWKIKSLRERWRTSSRDYLDAAWMELTEEDASEIKKIGLGEYIDINSSSCVEYEKLLNELAFNSVKGYMHLQSGVEEGELTLQKPIRPPMPFCYNRNLLNANIPIVPFKSSKLALPGDSGCPVFIEKKKNDCVELGLVGLAVGGNSNLKISAIMPLDEVTAAIREGGVRLVDHPELW